MKRKAISIVLTLALLLSAAAMLAVPAAAAGTKTVTSAADSGTGTLRAVLNSAVTGDVIEFQSNIGVITLKSELIVPSTVNSLTIDGKGKVTLRRNANDSNRFRLLNFVGRNPLTLRGLSFENGASAGASPGEFASYGGGVLAMAASLVLLENCSFTGNVSDLGGGIAANQLRAVNCTFTRNTGHFFGGGMGATEAVIENCSFSENSGAFGAALVTELAAVINSSFYNNQLSAVTEKVDGLNPRNDGSAVYASENIFFYHSTVGKNKTPHDVFVGTDDDEVGYFANSIIGGTLIVGGTRITSVNSLIELDQNRVFGKNASGTNGTLPPLATYLDAKIPALKSASVPAFKSTALKLTQADVLQAVKQDQRGTARGTTTCTAGAVESFASSDFSLSFLERLLESLRQFFQSIWDRISGLFSL